MAGAVIRNGEYRYINCEDLTEEHHSAIVIASSNMDSFAKLMSSIGANSCEVDFMSSLPLEIAELILRKLDSSSLLNSALVSRKWMSVCKGDSRLRKTIRHHLRKKNLSRMRGLKRPSKQNKTTQQTHCIQPLNIQSNPVPRPSPPRILQFPTSNLTKQVPKHRTSDNKSRTLTRSSLRLR